MIKKILLNSIVIIMISLSSEASQLFDPYVAKCSYHNLPKSSASAPLLFNHSNNIIALVGMPILTHDKIILVKGKLLDQNCVPIADATVRAWNNKYHLSSVKISDDNGNVHTISTAKNIIGAGSAITDNLGIFQFLVSLPINKTASNLNLSIIHPDFKVTNTKISFYPNDLNIEDIYLPEAISDTSLNSDGFNNKIPVYNNVIVLKGKNKYRRF